MQDHSLGGRVDVLEQTVFGPDGVTQQIGALRHELAGTRTEMRTDFAAVRDEMQTEFAAVRREMRTEFAAVRDEMQTEFAAVREEMQTEFAAVREEMQTGLAAVRDEMQTEFAAVRVEIGETKEAIAQTNVHMRVLHEEVLARLAVIGDSWKSSPPRRSRPRLKR